MSVYGASFTLKTETCSWTTLETGQETNKRKSMETKAHHTRSLDTVLDARMDEVNTFCMQTGWVTCPLSVQSAKNNFRCCIVLLIIFIL